MRSRRHARGRLTIQIGLMAVVVTTLSACITAPPMAFRLGSDGGLDVGSCTDMGEVTGVKFDLQHFVVPWAYEHDDAADLEMTFAPAPMPEGHFLSVDPGDTSIGLDLGADDWNRIEVTLVGTDFDLVDQVNRDQLVLDEWVWNRGQMDGAVRPCVEPTTSVRIE
ncbi:hypothetical protein [Agromyces sp. PvR057]|uniref:hypothetical protein n=1 Tax=Agromyces sp. PvR057 TaxID=3156403 RepID=UPI00339AC5A3